MESSDYAGELGSPPKYNDRSYEQLKRMENNPSPQIQSTVVTIKPDSRPVRDHIIWSLLNAMYLNFCCLGVCALAFSVKSRDRKLLGDRSGATSYGSTARSLNIAATILSILFMIVAVIIIIAQMGKAIEMIQQMGQKDRDERFGHDFGYGYGRGK